MAAEAHNGRCGRRHRVVAAVPGPVQSNCRSWLKAAAPAWCMAERIAISTASKSRPPLLRRSEKRSCSRCSTSRLISCWMISAVFFRWRQLLLFGRPQATQAGVHLHKFSAQLLPSAICLNLALGFASCGRRGKGLGHRLALLFVSQPKIGSVPGILGAVAMAMGVATAPSGGRDRTGPEVAQLGDFPQQGSFLVLQGGQRIGAIRHMGHNRSILSTERIFYTRLASPKKANPRFSPLYRAPRKFLQLDRQ